MYMFNVYHESAFRAANRKIWALKWQIGDYNDSPINLYSYKYVK